MNDDERETLENPNREAAQGGPAARSRAAAQRMIRDEDAGQ